MLPAASRSLLSLTVFLQHGITVGLDSFCGSGLPPPLEPPASQLCVSDGILMSLALRWTLKVDWIGLTTWQNTFTFLTVTMWTVSHSPALSLSLPFQFLWQGSSLLERAGARALTIDSRTCFQCLNLDQRWPEMTRDDQSHCTSFYIFDQLCTRSFKQFMRWCTGPFNTEKDWMPWLALVYVRLLVLAGGGSDGMRWQRQVHCISIDEITSDACVHNRKLMTMNIVETRASFHPWIPAMWNADKQVIMLSFFVQIRWFARYVPQDLFAVLLFHLHCGCLLMQRLLDSILLRANDKCGQSSHLSPNLIVTSWRLVFSSKGLIVWCLCILHILPQSQAARHKKELCRRGSNGFLPWRSLGSVSKRHLWNVCAALATRSTSFDHQS